MLIVVAWAGSRSLNIDTIWYDEWYSLYYAGAAPHYGPISVTQTVDRAIQYNEYNPPGYYIILNLWGQIAGWTPFAARALSLLMGILAIAFMYRLACQLAGATAGLGAAAALGTSAFFIHQLHEVRMYTLFTLWVALTLTAYWQYSYGKPNRRTALLFLVGLLGLLYTHYMALPLVIALALYHLVIAPKNRHWWIILLLAVGCGVLYVPWLGIAFNALGVVSGEGARQFFANDALTLVNNVLTQFSNGAVPLLIILGWYAFRSGKRDTVFVFGLLVCTLGLVLVLNERLHFISIARYLIALWPVLALVVGLGIKQMLNLKLYPFLLMVIWTTAGMALVLPRTLISEPKDPDWQVILPWDQVSQTLSETFFGREDDKDTLVFLLPEPTPFWFHAPLLDYYLRPLRPEVDNMPAWLRLAPTETPFLRAHLVESLENTSPEMFASEAETVVTNTHRLWLGYSPTDLPSAFAKTVWDTTLAEQGFTACTPFVQEPTLQLTLYSRISQSQLIARFGDSIQLGILETALDPQKNQLSFLLGWSISPEIPANTYSVGIYMDDAQGQPVAQVDFGIPVQSTACNRASLSLSSIPSGSYTLSSVVYNWQTGERLNGQSQLGLVDNRPQLMAFDFIPH